ncbi:hypothetical protein [Chryseobacterium rhizosphaerae]|jgi:hypothetical protein|uniref:hypothetical protein n=1 Tax=Chryseobacterium rhizosphaerae TaxID=395937 RepID=UPI002359D033|nr:hypothetical protein [Chryseobacterium rhizosphaerae]MDC8102318.1 hypothetical protein [Chryseobacterium rhizosphaerae]
MKNNQYFKKIGKFYHFLFLSVFSLLVLASCSKDNLTEENISNPPESGNLKKMGDLTVQKNVMILNDQSVASISNLNNQGITFSSVTAQTDSIKVGTVIVGTKVEGDHVNTILSKVTSISKTNNQLSVQTSSAKLEEFIYSGTISGIYDPSGKAPIQVDGKMVNYIPIENFISEDMNTKITAIESKNRSSQKSIILNRFNFDKTFPIPTQQVGPVTIASDIKVNGGFTPIIDYNITFSWGHLSDFKVNFIMDDLSLQSWANIQSSAGYTVSVTDYLNIPIAPIVLGPTGLILSPTIAAGPYLGAAATGKVQARLFDIGGKANFLVGINPDLNLDLIYKGGPDLNKLEGDLTAEVGIEAKGAVGLLFVTAPIANSGLRGRVSALSALGLQLIPDRKGTFDVKGKIQADMFYGFGVSPFRYEGTFPLFKKEYSIYHKELNF